MSRPERKPSKEVLDSWQKLDRGHHHQLTDRCDATSLQPSRVERGIASPQGRVFAHLKYKAGQTCKLKIWHRPLWSPIQSRRYKVAKGVSVWLLCICDDRGTIVPRLRDRTADSIQSIHSQEHWLPLGDQARRDSVRHRWSTALSTKFI